MTAAAELFRLDRHDAAPAVGDEEALVLVDKLMAKLRSGKPELDKLDLYYRARQPLSFLHPEISLAVGDRLRNLVINWPRLVLDTLEERLDVEGFRLPGQDQADDDIWSIWQANGFDEHSGHCHRSSLKHGRSFVSVWSRNDNSGMPRMAVETAQQMTVDYEPGTRDVRAALKTWNDGPVCYATLYLPDRILKYKRGGETGIITVTRSSSAWQRIDELENPLAAVPVVPFVNRYDLDMPDGETELADVLPLADAVNKLATDMMVSSEFHAMPRRWATGIEGPRGTNGTETKRLQEEAKAYWERATAGKVWLAGKDVTFGQFASADLSNFIAGIRLLGTIVAGLAGLPPHELGIMGDANPASADAIRAAEARLVKRAKRHQRSRDEPWETVMRLSIATRDGGPVNGMDRLETIWGDPETPTVAQKADAAVKLKTAGIIDNVQAQEDIGYSPAQRQRLAERQQAAIEAQATSDVAARVKQAVALMDTQGLDAKVAFAAVGLFAAAKGMAPGPGAPGLPAGDPIVSPDDTAAA